MSPAFSVILPVLFQQARRKWGYLAIVIVSLLIASSGLSSTLLISSAAIKSLATPPKWFSHVITRSQDVLSLEHYAKIRQRGVIDSVGFTEFTTEINETSVTLIGVDTDAMLNNNFRLTTTDDVAPDADLAPLSANALLTTQAHLTSITTSKPDTLILNNQVFKLVIADNSALAPIVKTDGPILFIDLASLYSLFPQAKEHGLTGIALKEELSQPNRAQLLSLLPVDSQIMPIEDNNDQRQMGQSFSFHLVAMAGLMAVVCFFIVTNALNMLMAYRQPLVENLHKLGISKTHTLVALCSEQAITCVVSVTLGCYLGIGLTLHFAKQISSSLSVILRSSALFDSVSISGLALISVAVSCLGMLIALAFPVARIYARPHSHVTGSSLQTHVILGGILVACTYVLLQFKTKLFDLLGLATLLLGLSLWVSVTIPKCFQWLAKVCSLRFALLHWLLNSGDDLAKRCKLSASAYFIALTAALGLSTMVGSFRDATNHWLNQRLAAPAYLYFSQDEPLPNIENIRWQPRWVGTGRIDNQTVSVSTYSTSSDYRAAMLFESAIEQPWQLYEQGNGIFVNQQLANRYGIRLGDTYDLQLEGNDLHVTVVGIYFDYGNPDSQVFIASSHAPTSFTRHPAVAIHPLEPSVDWDKVQAGIKQQMPQSNFIFKQGLLDLSLDAFDKTFLLTDLLADVALIVAALSFAMTIALLARHLDRQVNTLQTLGIALNQIRTAVVGQFCLICIWISLLALPSGLLFAKLLVDVINVNAFGWSYPLSVDISSIMQITGTGFALMLVIGGVTFWRRQIKTSQIRFSVQSVMPLLVLIAGSVMSGCSEQKESGLFDNASNQDLSLYEKVDVESAVLLPSDHKAHPDFQIEWWYLTAMLQDEQQQDYPFQFTVFRFNQQGTQRYTVHASMHTPDNHWFEERFAQPAMPYLTFGFEPFQFSLDNWSWTSSSEQPFPASVAVDWWSGPKAAFSFTPNGPFVKQGAEGISEKSADGNHVSYYYSHPFLSVDGSLFLEDGTVISLKGQGWYDHEWTSQLVSDDVDGWDWFSLHLDGGDKLMVFRMRVKDQPAFYTGTYINAAGQSHTLKASDFTLKPVRVEDQVPVEWNFTYPKKQLALLIQPVKKLQWNCGFTTYYEGGVSLSGSVKGKGFMELTGYNTPQSACEK